MLLQSWNFGAAKDFLAPLAAGVDGFTLGYIGDAAGPHGFAGEELENCRKLGYPVVDCQLAGRTSDEVAAMLAGVHAVYVAGGNTFVLMDAVRASGADLILTSRVRAGMPWLSSSAGSIIAGPSLLAVELMDDANAVPSFTDRNGLALTDTTIVPHAGGEWDVYPTSLIDRTLAEFGDRLRLQPLRNDQALLVDDSGERIVAAPAV